MILVSSISGVPINLVCMNLFIGCTGRKWVAALTHKSLLCNYDRDGGKCPCAVMAPMSLRTGDHRRCKQTVDMPTIAVTVLTDLQECKILDK